MHIQAPAETVPIEVLDAVMQAAYNAPSFRHQIEWYAAVETGDVVVATDGATDGAAVLGTGCSIGYPDAGFGWVGLIATAPAHERQGIGRLVTQHLVDALARRGCAAVLDASVAGAPLYARMGFVDHGATIGYLAPERAPTLSGAVAIATPADIGAITAYDAAAFGADRGALLRVLLGQFAGRAAVVRDIAGALAGYVVAQHSSIGPLIVDDPATLGELVSFACTQTFTARPRLYMPPESRHRAALEALGFEQFRELRHMRLGIDSLPGWTDRITARISLGVG
ncbi:MAG TPA: GNAT family N-acetyltransferase [Ilumatobacteraceae bacterium]